MSMKNSISFLNEKTSLSLESKRESNSTCFKKTYSGLEVYSVSNIILRMRE